MTSLDDALAAGVVVLDGGLATELEARGHDLSGGLWSARVLRERPQAVLAAHRAFVAAGAQVVTTSGYQVSAQALTQSGADPDDAEPLLHQGVSLARRALDAEGATGWVAGSVGPYGAALADGSEYTGAYGLGSESATTAALRAFHRPRLEALLAAGADVLACETVPRLAEVEALALELGDLAAPAWVSLTPAGGRTRRGESLAEAFAVLAEVPGLVGAGVNCCTAAEVAPAVTAVVAATGGPGVAYPNRGERWDGVAQTWRGDGHWDPRVLDAAVVAGARLVGGCCRVSPSDVAALRAVVRAV